jgi:hypothetical protein
MDYFGGAARSILAQPFPRQRALDAAKVEGRRLWAFWQFGVHLEERQRADRPATVLRCEQINKSGMNPIFCAPLARTIRSLL